MNVLFDFKRRAFLTVFNNSLPCTAYTWVYLYSCTRVLLFDFIYCMHFFFFSIYLCIVAYSLAKKASNKYI